MIGRAGSGRARNASMSFPRSATIYFWRLRSGRKIRGDPGLDVVGDLLRGAVLGIAEGTGAGEALIRARHVVGHAREGSPGHDRFVGRDLDEVELRVDAVVFA